MEVSLQYRWQQTGSRRQLLRDLCMASVNGWSTMTLDLVQTYPQAPTEFTIYITIPQGCIIDGEDISWCLEIINNIYGQKKAGKVWNDL
jgi:hypothetical protein